MVKAFENLIRTESTFDELKDRGVVFHLFANSGEGVYVPGANAAQHADAVLEEVFDAES